MPAGEERILKRRIRSVQSTKKVTRAMELIATSRIARSQARIAGSRPYVDGLTTAAADLAGAPGGGVESRLLGEQDDKGRAALIVVAADRGLCGAYNSNVLRATERWARARGGQDPLLVAVGRKAERYLRYRGHDIEHSVTGVTDKPVYADAREVASAILGPFDAEEVDSVTIISTRFLSAGRQKVEERTLIPLPTEEDAGRDEDGLRTDFEVEPDRESLLEALARRVMEAQVYLALLEASASEHAARQRAMKAASDNADDLIKTLTRSMNRVRQEAITTEIMEIVGGSEALRQADPSSDGGGGFEWNESGQARSA
ncbi:MAG: ATP synthase F1 subunit gamma [Acidimicrobiales bacterium]|nr:MAG: ATP synthase F1 subunit gamma [Acidimicrobiales bacterium]